MRIDFYLKTIFHYSKHEIQVMIKEQRIMIGNKIVERANEEVTDQVFIDHQKVTQEVFIYVMFNKPAGLLSDIRQGLLEFIDIDRKEDLRIMGRLDQNATGLMILTNDNHLIKEITMPGKHDKEYLVEVKYPLAHLELLEEGVIIDQHVQCLPARYHKIDNFHVKLSIKEGKYHQIKKMMKSLGNEVVRLQRIKINQLELDVEEGKYRLLDNEDLKKLKGINSNS